MPLLNLTKDPEEEYIELENFAELVQEASDKGRRFKMMFFEDNELEIWIARHEMNSIRSLAMRFHMSRYNIRKKISHADKKLKAIRKLLLI